MKKYVYRDEREIFFSAFSELLQSNEKDTEKVIQKIVKTIAANSSYWLSFLNLTYTAIMEVLDLLEKKQTDEAKVKLKELVKEIIEFRRQL